MTDCPYKNPARFAASARSPPMGHFRASNFVPLLFCVSFVSKKGMVMPQINLADIKQRLSLRELSELAGASFRVHKRDGASSTCPLHGGDNPTAFRLYLNGTRWHCFTRCKPGENDGDLLAFYMRWKGVDFKTALHELAELAGIPTSQQPTSLIVTPESLAARTPCLPSPKESIGLPRLGEGWVPGG